ncbi:hypothetical protein, partial [Nostoc sp. CHAB 5715]|uniref:hypothetical protein n=1 Tax=Nostoc sp. CHAB 5715 TaxID=2780400 RepID=UPI001E60DB8C
LLPMDSQDYDLNWSASAVAFNSKFEQLKQDTTVAELKAMLAKRDKGFERMGGIEKTSKNVTEWLD